MRQQPKEAIVSRDITISGVQIPSSVVVANFKIIYKVPLHENKFYFVPYKPKSSDPSHASSSRCHLLNNHGNKISFRSSLCFDAEKIDNFSEI